MRAWLSLVFCVSLLFVSFPASADESAGPAPVPATSQATCAPGWETSVYLATRPSVVRITDAGGLDAGGWGAGFFWQTRSKIVTAMHVVAHGRTFTIIFADGTKRRAKLASGDKESDVAILELEGEPADVRPLEFGDPATLPIGTPVLAIGHPFAAGSNDKRDEGLLTWSLSLGVISARNAYQVQLAIGLNPGNSGGPILDCEGRVLAVVSRAARSGRLDLASSVREVIELEKRPHLPAVSFAPTSLRIHGAAALRTGTFTTYGVAGALDVAFFDRVHVDVGAAGLIGVAQTIEGNRLITSRTGLRANASLGWSFRIWKFPIVPQVGLTHFEWKEHATSFVAGQPTDASATRSSTRFTPAIMLPWTPLIMKYEMELDFGKVADSAHFVAIGLTLL